MFNVFRLQLNMTPRETTVHCVLVTGEIDIEMFQRVPGAQGAGGGGEQWEELRQQDRHQDDAARTEEVDAV